MTIFRYCKNGLLYTITQDRGCRGCIFRAHPYKHKVEIGIGQKRRFREFKSGMSLKDFAKISTY